MPTFVGLNNRIYLGSLDLSGLANHVEFHPSRPMVDFTTFNDGGFACVKPGIITGQSTVSGFQDYAANTLDSDISLGQLGSQYPQTVIPNPTGIVAAGDPCWISRGFVNEINPLQGAIGDAAGFTLPLAFDAAMPLSKVLHPSTARTANGNGTAVALGGPTAAQSLYAALHVVAYSGFTNVVVTIESDDASGFPSPATRITFATVTGRTNEWKSLAGSFSTETHLRAVWTVTGAGSITFVVAAGVI